MAVDIPNMGAGVEKYFNTKGLSEYLLIPEQSIRRWVLNNEIPYHRIHGVIRYRMSEIDKWVDEHKEKISSGLDIKQEKELFTEGEAAETGGVEETQETETTDCGVEE